MIFGAHEEAAYIGLITVVLAVASPWLARRPLHESQRAHALPRALPWLWALLPVSVVLALGDNTPLYHWLFERVALLRLMRVPVRWLEVWTLAAVLLAGFAFDGCLHRVRSTPDGRLRILQRVFWVLAACSGILAITLFLLPSTSPVWQRLALWNLGGIERLTGTPLAAAADFLHGMALLEALLATLLLCIAAWLLRRESVFRRDAVLRDDAVLQGEVSSLRWTRSRPQLAILLLLLITCDLLFLFWRSARSIAPDEAQLLERWPSAITRYYTKEQRWDTGMGWYTLNRGILHGIDLYNGYDALSSKRFFDFASAAEGRHFWQDMYQATKHPPLLRVAGLSHTVSTITDPARGPNGPYLQARSGDWKLWRYSQVWPRVYLTRELFRTPEAGQLSQLAALAAAKRRTNSWPAVVHPGTFGDLKNTVIGIDDNVRKWDRGWNIMTIEVAATAPSLLVQSETLYPGWRAWVNGQPAELRYANYLFRAVRVPAGQSQVAVVYDTQTYRFSLFVTLCGLGMLSAMGVNFLTRGSGVLRRHRHRQYSTPN